MKRDSPNLELSRFSGVTISSISSRGEALGPNLLYSLLEKEGASSTYANVIEVT
jgi:hypothetical protein